MAAKPWLIFFTLCDVALVVFMAWRLFLILRGTKGVAFLYVLGVLFAMQVAGRYLPLPFFNAFVQLLTPMLLVAFPIIFQSELRRAFEQMGRRNFLARLFLGVHPEEARCIGAIVQAAVFMTGNRMGGLIVLERDRRLDEIAATGVRLDATISAELIQQVFMPRGPLHDGALLVRGQRLNAASCLLPLSDRLDLDKRLGTRHRAGLGMAEVSDAVIIVISEERGALSLAVDGHLEQSLTPEQLTHRLAELLVENGRERVLENLHKQLGHRGETRSQ